MKSAFEKVRREPGSFISLLNRRLASGIPFEWHHHPEYELTLTLNSRGHRFVGDHHAPYDDGDLVLVGPNLPHTWHSTAAVDPSASHVAIVSWFTEAWASQVIRLMPELAPVGGLLRAARRGVRFSRGPASEVRPLVEAMPSLPPDKRLLALLEVLRRLAGDDHWEELATGDGSPDLLAPDPRLQRVLDHLHAHAHEKVDVDGLAQLACLSPSALHRMFLRHTHMTPIAYVVRLRIGIACSMLMEGNSAIAAVAESAGFRNLASFNRQFRALKGTTPRQFRALHARKGRAPASPP